MGSITRIVLLFACLACGKFEVQPAAGVPTRSLDLECNAQDDTVVIQTALNTTRSVRLPSTTCVVGPLHVQSDTFIEFQPATILRAKAGYVEGQSLLNIVDVSNVTILGNGGTVLMNKAEYKSGEQRHGVLIKGSSGVRIYDLHSSDAGGDGFYIGTGHIHNYCSNVTLYNCVADNNRRNGLSIVSGKNVLIVGGEFRNTQGTSPEAGIDIEPNNPTDLLENIRLFSVKTSNNRGGGITVAPYALGQAPGNVISLSIDGFTSEHDSRIAEGGGIRLVMPVSLAHPIAGLIAISNSQIVDPGGWGVSASHWVSKAPRVVFNNVTVQNPNAAGRGVADFGWSAAENTIAANSGFVVAMTSSDAAPATQHLEFINCRAIDRRANPTMARDFYFHSSSPAKTIDATVQ